MPADPKNSWNDVAEGIWRLWCTAAVLLVTMAAPRVTAQTPNAQDAAPQSTQIAAKQLFEARCAACHGLDGRGGEHAPDIVGAPAAKSRPDRELFQIIRGGIAAKGMPSFLTLGDQKICMLVEQVHALQGTTVRLAASGDPAHGKQLFEGQSHCSDCHAMKGTGSFVSTDLSDFASSHDAGEIRNAIVNPKQSDAGAGTSVTATTVAGERYAGFIRNEDNASLQIQDAQGRFYLLMKSNLSNIERSAGPAMPLNYRQQLGEKDIEDLVSDIVHESPTFRLEAAPSSADNNGSATAEQKSSQHSVDDSVCKNR